MKCLPNSFIVAVAATTVLINMNKLADRDMVALLTTTPDNPLADMPHYR